MRTPFAILGIAAATVLFTAGAPKGPPMVFRIHAETGSQTTEPFAFVTAVGNPPVEVRVEKMPLVTEREVIAFYPFVSASGGYGTYFQLDKHGSNSVEQVSSSNQNRFLVAFFNGRPISRLRIDRPVRDGVVIVPDGILPEEIHHMGQHLPLIGESSEQTERRRKEDRRRNRTHSQ